MKTIHLTTIAAIALCQTAPAQAPAALESAVTLNAADLLPAEQLRGDSHRVRDMVVTDGFLAHFEIDTDFGTFEAVGVPQVKQRIAEANAIRKLVETSKTDLFAEGLKRSINQPIDAVKNIAKDPVTSIKRAPKTVGHFFSKVGASVERGVDRIKADNEAGHGPSAAAIGASAKNAAGFDKAKLDTARQLGVDPYSDNKSLQEEMDKVTWAFFAGGLPLRIGAAVASAGVAVAATNMVGIPEETYALTQAELALRDNKSLTAMGLKEEDISNFQIQPNLSTTRRHRIVKALEAILTEKGLVDRAALDVLIDTYEHKVGPRNGARVVAKAWTDADFRRRLFATGRGRIILLANSCETTDQADFLIAALEMLVERQRTGASDYKQLHVFGRLPGATTATGMLEVPAPVDHVTWTSQVAAFASRNDLGTAPKTLIHTGRLSPATAAGFTAAGWQTVAVPY